jgi:hypothetical protein
MIDPVLEKQDFLLILKVNPPLLIGKTITYRDHYRERNVKILDVSLGGDYFLIETPSTARIWVMANSVGDTVVVEAYPRISAVFTASSVNGSIETLFKMMGQPATEQTKPLFEIMRNLNKELFELKSKIREMEKNYDYD